MRLNWKTFSRRLRGKGGNHTLPSALEGVPEFARPMVAAYHGQQFARKIRLALSALVLLCVLGPVCAFSGPLTALGLLAGAGAVGAIQYPSVGSIYYTQFSPSSVSAILDALKNALTTCGWSLASSSSSKVVLTFTGLPANTQNCTFDGVVYTYKTTLASAFDVKIGADANACAANLVAAITAGAGAGTTYGTGTTAHPTCTASAVGGVVTVSAISAGAGPFAASEGLNNATLDQTASYAGGYNMRCAATPQGLQAGVILDLTPGNSAYARLRCCTADFSSLKSASDTTGFSGSNGVFGLAVAAGRTLEFCGNAHQFMVFLLNDSSTAGTKVLFTCPFTGDSATPTGVSAASNASPIQITTSAAHGLNTGDDVFISDVTGNTAANGFFTVTVTGSTTFTLNGSTGNGAYVSGGLVANKDQTSRCMWMHGDHTSSYPFLRTASMPINSGYAANYFWAYNQYSYAGYAASGQMGLVTPQLTNTTTKYLRLGMRPASCDARIVLPVTSSSQSSMLDAFQFWAALVVCEANVGDRIVTGFDGHNWINYLDSDPAKASLYFAKS